jgi:hypothetical protein
MRVAALLLPVALCGCAGFYDEIFLNADGSGSYRLTVFVGKGDVKENVEALKTTVRHRAAKLAAEAGFALKSVDVRRDGTLLVIEVTADFDSLSVFASPALAVAADGGQWSFVVPREASFRGGRFAARVLRESAPSKDRPIRSSFSGHEARFTVHLPGDVLQANGERFGRSANWILPLDLLCDAPVEMVAVSRSSFPVLPVALGVALLGALAVVGRSVFRKRPDGGQRPRAA